MYLSWLEKYNLLIFDEIDSTNAEAMRLIKAGCEGDFVIWARNQTAGKGQYGRQWHSFEGNLYLSLLLDRNIPIAKQPQLSFVAAIALWEAINLSAKKDTANINVALKWPNDLLVHDKKVAGILLESIRYYDRNYLVIGVGVNICHNPHLLDKLTANLEEEGLVIKDLSDILTLFIACFDKYFGMWESEGFIKIRKLWLNKAYKLNQVIRVDNNQERISGIFKDIDFNGNLRVQLASGQICSFSAGDVIYSGDAIRKQ